ncbi:OmpA family protein [Psychrobacter immobilis]|uniref:OmpA family protein n=1 Tax=Psychrobacter immobilis TaxID=498 RepID=UPI001919FA3B|nr:OmpA family protein [Psychrobacter immobilis]
MKTNSWMMIGVVIASFMLTSCQSIPTKGSIHKESYNIPKVMIEPHVDTDSDGVPDIIDNCPNTPEGVKVDPYGCPLTTIGTGLQMEYRAFFAKGSSELTSKYQAELDKVAARMKEYDTAIFKIEAHISEDEIHKELSSLPKNRALIIKNYLLLKHGIESSRLMSLNCDARAPIAPNDTEEGRAFNRRVYGLLTEPDSDYPINLKDGICVEF